MAEKRKRRRSGGGKPAKPLSEFRQIRAGTTRHRILELMSYQNGSGAIEGNTIDTIATDTGVTTMRVLQHAYCLWRDIGIGYRLRADGHLLAIYPESKTLTDAVREAKD